MSIPSSLTPLFNSGSSAAGGLQIERSIRLNSADSAYLSRTPGTASSRTTWTYSLWVKRSTLDTDQRSLLTVPSGASDNDYFQFGFYQDKLYVVGYSTFFLITTQVFRDVSAWMHIMLVADTTNATDNNRLRLYVNGSEVTVFGTRNNPSPSQSLGVNRTAQHQIGSQDGSYYLNGYLANIHFIDGQALTPSSFTETDATTGQLIPKTYSGSYGTNGFNLLFADNSSNTASTLGKDTSGLSNNFTPNNFQATVQTGRLYAQSSGTSTSAFSSATLLGNFPASGLGYTIFDADLVTSVTSATFSYTYVFGGVVEVLVSADGTSWTSKGLQSSSYTTVTNASAFRYVRWFYSTFNFGINNNPAGNDSLVDSPTNYGTDTGVGGEVRGNYCTWNPLASASSSTLSNGNLDAYTGTTFPGTVSATFGMSTGKWYWEITFSGSNYGPYIGIKLTAEATTSYPGQAATSYSWYSEGSSYSKKYNNSIAVDYSLGVGFTLGDIIGVAFNADTGSLEFYKNGTSQGVAFTGISAGTYVAAVGDGTNAGGPTLIGNFGQRAFAYTAPSGFKALCTTNLPATLVTKSNTVFDALIWSGDSVNNRKLTTSFGPDLFWAKQRNGVAYHSLNDSVRGPNAMLQSNTTTAEQVNSNGYVITFASDGVNVSNGSDINASGSTYVGWAWDAGTSTVSNTAGSITSQVRANATAGFSVATYTGTGSNATVGHGLGVTPTFYITKRRDNAAFGNWTVYHSSVGTQALELNETGAAFSDSTRWPSAATSTVFNIGSNGNVNTSSGTYVAYVFAPVVGYSNFGSYTGTSAAQFIYLGFRPKFWMHKLSSSAGSWMMLDSSRDPYNVAGQNVYANLSNAESTYSGGVLDFVSNGVVLRSTGNDVNGSGNTYIYMCFAEAPFNYSRAR